MFSSRGFPGSDLTFKPLIELIFVYGVRQGSTFILLHVAIRFFSHQVLKRLSFSHCIFSAPLLKIDHICQGLFLGSIYSVPLIYVSVFTLIPYCFDDYSFVMQFEIRKHDTSSFVALSQDCFDYSASFVIPYKFQDCFFYFCEKCYWIGLASMESVECFGQCGHFNNINSSNA